MYSIFINFQIVDPYIFKDNKNKYIYNTIL